ncbi:MAG: LON peptidase substrate-binding domain-containing protein [Chloroflexi bacterium]|nr:LON peptidase substrate-binding domain-containing protein [Chloroflexota bacterium]MCY3697340.1 LON peptidase substrate-binding domain-containing protein [Chloroflexota bacterium]
MPELPLFPLQIVVFPGETVPLHIFEPRYRQLVKDTLETNEPFGIVLTRRGRQTASPEEREPTHEVGCTVRMESNEAFPDGRFNIGCIGDRRFRIIEKLGERPYWVAEVEFIDDPDDRDSDGAHVAYDAAADLYRDHLGLALALQNSWQRSYRLPRQPYPLVNHIASRIEAPATVKQEILKSESTVEQLNLLSRILRASNRQLTDRVHLHHRQRYEGLGVGN